MTLAAALRPHMKLGDQLELIFAHAFPEMHSDDHDPFLDTAIQLGFIIPLSFVDRGSFDLLPLVN
jgi:hypothetical protein